MIRFCSAHCSRVMQSLRFDRREPVSAIGRHTICVPLRALASFLLPLSASAAPLGMSKAAIKISLFIAIPIESAVKSPLARPKSSSTLCAAALKQDG